MPSLEELEEQEQLKANNYHEFKEACQNGQTDVIEKLWEWAQQDPETKQAMLSAWSHHGFRSACENGHTDVIEKLWGLAPDPETKKNMLEAYDYYGFRSACVNGQTDVIEKLWQWAPDTETQQAMLSANYYDGFRFACVNGHTETIEKLLVWAQQDHETKQAMLSADDYDGFRSACENGHTETIEKLWQWAPDTETQQAMLSANYYDGFRSACVNGQTDVIEKLWELAPDTETQQAMLSACNYNGFRFACVNGHTETIEKLWQWAPDTKTKKNMLSADNYYGFRFACENGHTETIEKLWQWAPDTETQQAMLSANYYDGFRSACENGHTETIEKLLVWAQQDHETKQAMLSAWGHHGFRSACTNGHTEIIEKLWQLAQDPETKKNMLSANDYSGFRSACNNGHNETIEKLWELAQDTEKKQAMLSANDYSGFRSACNNGHNETIEKLWQWAPDTKTKKNMLSADNYYGFRFACENGRTKVIEKLWDHYFYPEDKNNAVQQLEFKSLDFKAIEILYEKFDDDQKSFFIGKINKDAILGCYKNATLAFRWILDIAQNDTKGKKFLKHSVLNHRLESISSLILTSKMTDKNTLLIVFHDAFLNCFQENATTIGGEQALIKKINIMVKNSIKTHDQVVIERILAKLNIDHLFDFDTLSKHLPISKKEESEDSGITYIFLKCYLEALFDKANKQAKKDGGVAYSERIIELFDHIYKSNHKATFSNALKDLGKSDSSYSEYYGQLKACFFYNKLHNLKLNKENKVEMVEVFEEIIVQPLDSYISDENMDEEINKLIEWVEKFENSFSEEGEWAWTSLKTILPHEKINILADDKNEEIKNKCLQFKLEFKNKTAGNSAEPQGRQEAEPGSNARLLFVSRDSEHPTDITKDIEEENKRSYLSQ